MKVLVCGGRDFHDQDHVNYMLDKLHSEFRFTHLIEGGASGADYCAAQWAEANNVQIVRCPANWNLLGRRAGAIRNLAMLELNPKRVIHFPGGRGTSHMVESARAAGIPTIDASGNA